jgi:hypothetical protein
MQDVATVARVGTLHLPESRCGGLHTLIRRIANLADCHHPGANDRERTMSSLANPARAATGYVLRFESLFDSGRSLAFECDAQGHVDLDQMTERAKLNYLHARTVIGRDFALPFVERAVH